MFGFLKKFLGRGETRPLFCSAVVPAAGASSRMEGENKLFASLGGAPVLGRPERMNCWLWRRSAGLM